MHSTMEKKKKRLIHKVKRLLRQTGIPRWLNHLGSKKYEFWQHALALIVKQECKLGYRRVSRLLNWLGYKTPTYSALAKMLKRVPWQLWQKVLNLTNKQKLNLVAIDGTGLSRPLPSPYYYRRIDKPYPVEVPLKLSIAIDTRTKRVLSLRLRAKSCHDIRDAKYLINRLPSLPRKLVADKGYDAEWLHRFCYDKGIKAVIPIRNYGKPKHRSMSLRNNQNIKKKTYGRREMVESVIGALKRKFGASVSSISAHTRRAEIYCRAIAHNIIAYLVEEIQRSHLFRNLYKPTSYKMHNKRGELFK